MLKMIENENSIFLLYSSTYLELFILTDFKVIA